MEKSKFINQIRRVDVQVSIITAVIVIFSSLCISAIYYKLTYDDMIRSLVDRVYSIYNYLEDVVDKTTFFDINTKEDKNKASYKDMKEIFENVKKITGVRYLYTAKRNNEGDFIYIIDGLDIKASDFRFPGDKIEYEIYSDMQKALLGNVILPSEIKSTEWGKIFITYFPVHNGNEVVGVLGIEFEAEHQYNVYLKLRIITPIIIFLSCIISVVIAIFLFRRISNPLYQDMYNTDQLTQLKNRNAYDIDIKNISAGLTQKGMGIISIDLNNLKEVNDTLGHQAGDVYIQKAAQAILLACKDDEIPYRVGGDEFVIIIRNTENKYVENIIKNIKEIFNSYSCNLNTNISTSIAAGYAVFDENIDRDIFDTYRRADSNMYENKRKYHLMNNKK